MASPPAVRRACPLCLALGIAVSRGTAARADQMSLQVSDLQEFFDRPAVDGRASRTNRLLVITFADGHPPAAGQSFDLIDVGGQFSGLGAADIFVTGLVGWHFLPQTDSSGKVLFALQADGVANVPVPGVLVPFAALPFAVLRRTRRSAHPRPADMAGSSDAEPGARAWPGDPHRPVREKLRLARTRAGPVIND